MILIGIGGNLESAGFGGPRSTLSAALAGLEAEGICVRARSGWYRTQPVPPSDQPWFINAVASLVTELGAVELLGLLQTVETRFGRVGGERNAARVVDLDLLDYNGKVQASPRLVLPHPRLHQRRFVLSPLAEIAPHWRHPVLGLTAVQLITRLSSEEQSVQRLSC